MVAEAQQTEHEQAMVDLVDTKEAEAVGNADPEKASEYVEETSEEVDYKAKYEELLASGNQQQETPTDTLKGLEVPEDKPVEETIQPELITPDALDKYTKEFNSEGGISEESYQELQKSGYSKEIVDNYIQGQAAIAQAQTQKVFDKVGGQEAYSDMVTWARETMSQEQIEIFNNQVNSGDETQVMYGVDSLIARYNAAKESPMPNRALKGTASAGGNSNTGGFNSKADMYKAMDNRLYGKDASYTNMVTKRIEQSNF